MERRNIYEKNYARLAELLGQAPEDLDPQHVYRLRSEGFMDLVIEKLSPSPTRGAAMISMAHYFKQGGDLCQDPEIVLRVYPPGLTEFQELAPSTDPELGRVEALMFQQGAPPVFQAVYPRPGQYDPQLKKDLNRFLALWLRNLKKQGHRMAEKESLSATESDSRNVARGSV